ncbi:hypothetical protein D3C72_1793320 [compost metagenome]
MVRRMAPHHQRAEELIAKREQAAAQSVAAKTASPPRIERFTRPGVERFDRPGVERLDRPGVERLNRPGVERFDRPARPGVERFDTALSRRPKPETAGS